MKIIDLEQNTPEWHLFRSNHIGASDASVIMGSNPWRKKINLWEEKVLGWAEKLNDNMKRGQMMEKSALESYQNITGISMKPLVAEDIIYSFLSASFDGISDDRKNIVEIKCGKSSHSFARKKKIPEYYYAQMQHQMYIANLDSMDYFSFDGNEGILMRVEKNNSFIFEMLEKEIEFWHCIMSLTPPKD